MEKTIELNSEKINKRERNIKILKIGLLMSALFLFIIYAILRLVYEQGAFTISLDQNFAKKSGLILFEDMEIRESKRVLEAEKKEWIDNISINWLPDNLHEHSGGAHNGDNYIAYTFYIENQGSSTVNYWYTILIDDVIKDVDNAIRVMIYQNGEKKVYAKAASDGDAEPDTIAFKAEDTVLIEAREAFEEGAVDKYTIVIWIEGDDPDCIDALIGGQMKMHMEVTEEHLAE